MWGYTLVTPRMASLSVVGTRTELGVYRGRQGQTDSQSGESRRPELHRPLSLEQDVSLRRGECRERELLPELLRKG